MASPDGQNNICFTVADIWPDELTLGPCYVDWVVVVERAVNKSLTRLGLFKAAEVARSRGCGAQATKR